MARFGAVLQVWRLVAHKTKTQGIATKNREPTAYAHPLGNIFPFRQYYKKKESSENRVVKQSTNPLPRKRKRQLSNLVEKTFFHVEISFPPVCSVDAVFTYYGRHLSAFSPCDDHSKNCQLIPLLRQVLTDVSTQLLFPHLHLPLSVMNEVSAA